MRVGVLAVLPSADESPAPPSPLSSRLSVSPASAASSASPPRAHTALPRSRSPPRRFPSPLCAALPAPVPTAASLAQTSHQGHHRLRHELRGLAASSRPCRATPAASAGGGAHARSAPTLHALLRGGEFDDALAAVLPYALAGPAAQPLRRVQTAPHGLPQGRKRVPAEPNLGTEIVQAAARRGALEARHLPVLSEEWRPQPVSTLRPPLPRAALRAAHSGGEAARIHASTVRHRAVMTSGKGVGGKGLVASGTMVGTPDGSGVGWPVNCGPVPR